MIVVEVAVLNILGNHVLFLPDVAAIENAEKDSLDSHVVIVKVTVEDVYVRELSVVTHYANYQAVHVNLFVFIRGETHPID